MLHTTKIQLRLTLSRVSVDSGELIFILRESRSIEVIESIKLRLGCRFLFSIHGCPFVIKTKERSMASKDTDHGCLVSLDIVVKGSLMIVIVFKFIHVSVVLVLLTSDNCTASFYASRRLCREL